MNFYEELGLTASASLPEIMHSYKDLCRILHPDRQQQASLKKVAECQMRRLNDVIEVLGDKERRRAYNRSIGLNTRTTPPGHAPSQREQLPGKRTAEPRSTRSVWLVAVLVGMLIIYVLVREDVHSTGTAAARGPASPGFPQSDNQEIAQLRKTVEDLQRRLSALERHQQHFAGPQ